VKVRLQARLRESAAGKFVIAVADATNVVPDEPNELNNIVPSPAVQ
jgi:hypothetical protein